MVVHHPYPLAIKGMQNRFIEHDQGPVFPERGLPPIEAQSFGNYWQ